MTAHPDTCRATPALPRGGNEMRVLFDHRAALVALAAVLGSLTAAPAAELDPKAVQIKTPDQFKWRNPSMQPPNNAVLLADPAHAASLFLHIHSFVPPP